LFPGATDHQTVEVVIVFLDEDGDPIPRASVDTGLALSVTIGDNTLVTWAQGSLEDGDHDDDVAFAGVLSATTRIGGTTLEFCLLHDGHCDYESPTIAVTVV
jgi:hypothetical protein